MIAIVWEFVVASEAVREFERAYGPDGDWAALFRRHPGYEGTTLLRDRGASNRFWTIDRWRDLAAFDAMRQGSHEEYADLDRSCGRLTSSERELGVFDVA